MAAKVRHTQTQEELHTNGDTNSPKASNGHLIPLDQKVKDTARKKKKKRNQPQPRLGSLGLLCGLELQLTPHKETEGRKEPISLRKTVLGTSLQVSLESLCMPSPMNHCRIIQ